MLLHRGQGYIETDRVHLSSGLVLPFADGIVRTNQRGYYPDTWLLSFDLVCLDPSGTVTSITQLPLGA